MAGYTKTGMYYDVELTAAEVKKQIAWMYLERQDLEDAYLRIDRIKMENENMIFYYKPYPGHNGGLPIDYVAVKIV